jgi:tetratricopeptide (TPR) repeat protein
MTYSQRSTVQRNAVWTRAAILFVVVTMVAGCAAAGRAYRRGDSASRAGDWDTAVEQYRQAVQGDPDRAGYRIAYERAMITASQLHLDQARIAEARGLIEEAMREYRRASEYDPSNRGVAAKALEMERRLREQAEAAQPNNLRTLREQARQQGPAPLFNLNTIVEPIQFNNAQVRDILGSIDGIAFVEFTHKDVVRHKLVQRIVEAYKQHAEETGTARSR